MTTATVNERKNNNAARKARIINIVKKVILYTIIAIVGVFALVALYQIVKFLFVAAILLIAWLGPVGPRRWWW